MTRKSIAWVLGATAFTIFAATLLSMSGVGPEFPAIVESSQAGSPSPLPLPSTMSVPEYEVLLYEFLASKSYLDLGWKKDRAVRDTGPFINNTAYGVHPAVRIYYSPEVYEWLKAGRPDNGIPDGAMIIKEMYTPQPAARYADDTDADLRGKVNQWTVMVKDSVGSKDGWFWSYHSTVYPDSVEDTYPFSYPDSGYGLYCMRCHASTEAGKELTFSSLRNIEGEEAAGSPIVYRVDDSWIVAEREAAARASHPATQPGYDATADRKPLKDADPDFLALFDELEPVGLPPRAP